MINEFKSHIIVKHIRKYCKSNGIKLTISTSMLGNLFDPASGIMHIEDTPGKSLSYKLFIIAHEYGHLFQHVMNKDSLNVNTLDEFIYSKLRNGENVTSKKKKQMIRALLTEEYRATSIGLQLLKVFNKYPTHTSMKMIKRQANLNMLKYYMWLNYGYDITALNYFVNDIPYNGFIIPLSSEFNTLVRRIRPQLKLDNKIKNILNTHTEYT